MLFKTSLVISLAASVLALPASVDQRKTKRADVLKVQNYADFQVSDGVAGNALGEVDANFPIDTSDLANVSDNDLAIIKSARETAEAAETDKGGFNDAIEQAGEDTAAGKALQVGKIKNKVLKLRLEVLALQIEQAQGGKDNSDKIEEEQTKLNNNIQLDTKAKGQPSQSVDFQGDDAP
ncbi:hypothetical protein VTK73DRAFT_5595 [Phialemonium thermophilum]|uniref:Small secreted protein n=1 Tax=Phialemonium thermophilum TaxID=223376 RepID=A0ABR3WN56_9PEZI